MNASTLFGIIRSTATDCAITVDAYDADSNLLDTAWICLIEARDGEEVIDAARDFTASVQGDSYQFGPGHNVPDEVDEETIGLVVEAWRYLNGRDWLAYLELCNDQLQVQPVADFEDAYQGRFESRADYAQELWDGDCSQWPYSCIDWDEAADELEMGGDVTFLDADTRGAVYAFRP